MNQKICQIILDLKRFNVQGGLYLEGSYSEGTNDQYSDIDLSFIVDKNNYYEATIQIGNILKDFR